MDKTKAKSLLIIISFVLILILPASYALIRYYFFTPKTEAKQIAPQPGEGNK